MTREEMIGYYKLLFKGIYGTGIEDEDFSSVSDKQLSERISELIGYNMSK